jgi:hypothetical protein
VVVPVVLELMSDVELVRVLAVDLLIEVTAAHSWSAAMSEEEPAFLFVSALHVRSTLSPALMSFRLATALPWTGRVMLIVSAAVPVVVPPVEPAERTVMVFDEASTDTTSALTVAFFLESLSSALAVAVVLLEVSSDWLDVDVVSLIRSLSVLVESC